MYSTNPLISHLGSAFLPMSTVFLRLLGFGGSSKFPLAKSPEQNKHRKESVKYLESKQECLTNYIRWEHVYLHTFNWKHIKSKAFCL